MCFKCYQSAASALLAALAATAATAPHVPLVEAMVAPQDPADAQAAAEASGVRIAAWIETTPPEEIVHTLSEVGWMGTLLTRTANTITAGLLASDDPTHRAIGAEQAQRRISAALRSIGLDGTVIVDTDGRLDGLDGLFTQGSPSPSRPVS